jgi:hypothetical protein
MGKGDPPNHDSAQSPKFISYDANVTCRIFTITGRRRTDSEHQVPHPVIVKVEL